MLVGGPGCDCRVNAEPAPASKSQELNDLLARVFRAKEGKGEPFSANVNGKELAGDQLTSYGVVRDDDITVGNGADRCLGKCRRNNRYCSLG